MRERRGRGGSFERVATKPVGLRPLYSLNAYVVAYVWILVVH